jgi:hypothetical protein
MAGGSTRRLRAVLGIAVTDGGDVRDAMERPCAHRDRAPCPADRP